MGAVGFTYEVPIGTDWTTVKTFTFEAIACGVCINWARISCCPGEMRISIDGPETMYRLATGGAGPHYQLVNAATRIVPFHANGRVVSEVRVEAKNAASMFPETKFCGGVTVEAKTCITFTDTNMFDNTCVCSGTCPPEGHATPSYVDIT